ncbi:MAG: response regulator transcription factor [Desulfuromonadales bacterium]|nr:response regulator transcription factor [Desulfuromonadales bacterium]
MKKHILVIDDDPVLLTIVADYLKDAGFAVSTANCGIYSNNIIYGKNPPGMIILDVIMPLMSGVKKAKLLKKREKSAHIPILLMSSKDEQELKALADEAMANDYLCKPFTAEHLMVKIRSLLP